MWRYVIGRIVPDVTLCYWANISGCDAVLLGEYFQIFRWIVLTPSSGSSVHLIGLFDPEDWSTTITRNVRKSSPSNTMSHPTRRLQQHRCENLHSFVDQTPTWLPCFKSFLTASHVALWFTFSKIKASRFGHKTLFPNYWAQSRALISFRCSCLKLLHVSKD